MYEINFHTKFSSTWFASLSIAASSFTFFGQFDSTKLNSIRKVLDGKVRNFSPTKISSFTVAGKRPMGDSVTGCERLPGWHRVSWVA